MTRKAHGGSPPAEDSKAFDRQFRYALIAYAVVEFFAIALALYYQAAR